MKKTDKTSIDETLYNEKSLDLLNIRELRDIGRKFGVPSPTTMKKQELISYILKIVYGELTPSRSNYGRPHVREFNMNQYVSKIKKNSDLTDELLKIKLNDYEFSSAGIGELKLASPKSEEINNIESRVFVEEDGKCFLRVHGFVASDNDIEIDNTCAKNLGLENFDVVEVRIEEGLFKIITVNGMSKTEELKEVLNAENLENYKQVFYIRTKEEREDKIEKIANECYNRGVKLLIFASKKYTDKCTELVEYDTAEGYPKMYKNYMRFVSLCEKYVFEGENIAIIVESFADLENMCDSFDEEVGDRIKTNIQRTINRFVALENIFVSFRIETPVIY